MIKIEKKQFGTTADGQAVHLFTLRNEQDACVSIHTFGGAVTSIQVPDLKGSLTDVVLGYDQLTAYENQDKYIGALVGRCGNRIEKGTFSLNGKTYALYCNNGANHLHGGKVGFDKKIWAAKPIENGLELSYTSRDGEEGYPGTLAVTVKYLWSKDNTLSIDYSAVADADTVCNLTNHTYFNLSGYDSGTVLDQKIQLFADAYTEANDEALPNGNILPVAGTPLDLRRPVRIGAHIDEPFEQLQFAGGYDHNWVINGDDNALKKMAWVCAEDTGVTLTAYTTLPGVQFYTGNYLDGAPTGKNGAAIGNRCGFCLESQYFPNALHQPNFAQPILKKGAVYHALTKYQFGLL